MVRLLIALDVDGTIVHHDGVTISPRVSAAVRATYSMGHHVVLSTGRSPASTLPVTAALGLGSGFAVCSNGSVTLRLDVSAPGGHTVLANATFDPHAALEVIERMWPGCAVAVEVPGVQGFRATESFPRAELAGDVVMVPWERLGARGASRLVVHAAASPAQVARVVGDLGLTSVEDTSGSTGAVEIGPRAVSKASALEALRADLGIAAVNTVAVGDHVNDVEMLRWAGRGIAMGQAPAVARDAATEVAPAVEDDGLAVVLESLVALRTSPPEPSQVS